MQVFSRRKRRQGFTLIELMIVIAIIGILAAIAIPQFSAYRLRGYNTSAKTDLKNAYTSAQAFFVDSPSGTVTLALLTTSYGYRQGANITLAVGASSNTQASLGMNSVHAQGDTTYAVVADGTITP